MVVMPWFAWDQQVPFRVTPSEAMWANKEVLKRHASCDLVWYGLPTAR